MALLKPEAKNPPNGATKLANKLRTIACIWNYENDRMPNIVGWFVTKNTEGISQNNCSKGASPKS